MDDLIAFLNARLDEDEAAAKAAGADSWRATENGAYHEDVANFPGPFAVGPYEYLEDDERAHIARHDPARVLREVAAKRAILCQWEHNDQHDCNGDPDSWAFPYIGCHVARHLAAVYSGHPDYDPAWAPATASAPG